MELPSPPRRAPLGARGEALAAAHYEERGARVLERNLRTPHGEIDLLVADGRAWVAVEVKTRTRPDGAAVPRHGEPAEAVSGARVRRIGRALEGFAASRGRGERPLRVDVVEVLVDRRGELLDLRVHEDVTS